MATKLTLVKEGSKLGGVCTGIAKWADVDVFIPRLIFLLGIWPLGGGLLIYILFYIAMPNEK